MKNKSDLILEEFANGRSMAHAIAGANFAILLTIVNRPVPSPYDSKGVLAALFGVFSMLLISLVIYSCQKQRKVPAVFNNVVMPFFGLGLISSIISLNTIVRPFNDNYKYVTIGLLIAIGLVLYSMMKNLKYTDPF